MNFDTYKKKGFFKNIKSLYRFQIIDTHTYDVKWVIELSKLNVLVITSFVFGISLILALAIFALTPLKYLLPGYVGTKADDKREMIQLKMKVETLENQVDQYSQYYSNLQAILQDSIQLHSDYIQNQETTPTDNKPIFPKASETEINYRKDFEILFQKDQNTTAASRAYLLNKMQFPMEGKTVALSSEEATSKTLKVEAEGETGVNCVLGGVVISVNQFQQKVTILIQHELEIISSYQFEGKATVQRGERLQKGQLIGIIQEKGSKILSFDLWEEGNALAPGQYLKY